MVTAVKESKNAERLQLESHMSTVFWLSFVTFYLLFSKLIQKHKAIVLLSVAFVSTCCKGSNFAMLRDSKTSDPRFWHSAGLLGSL